MRRLPPGRLVVLGLLAIAIVGCQPAEVGTIGRESKVDALPTGSETINVKGKKVAKETMETLESRK